MVLTLNEKRYEITENNVWDEDGFPPYRALQEGNVVICQYEDVTRSGKTEVVYKCVISVDEMTKLYNSAEEGMLLNMCWHLAKEVPLTHETGSQATKLPSLRQNGHKSPIPDNAYMKICLS